MTTGWPRATTAGEAIEANLVVAMKRRLFLFLFLSPNLIRIINHTISIDILSYIYKSALLASIFYREDGVIHFIIEPTKTKFDENSRWNQLAQDINRHILF